jgi:WD40-like Beta Propeller Repeat
MEEIHGMSAAAGKRYASGDGEGLAGPRRGRRTASKRWSLVAGAAGLLSLIVLVLFGAQASAVEPPESTYLGSFGPDGTEATNFEYAQGVGVDEQAGVVYVADVEGAGPGALYKFDEAGHPVDFTGTAPYIDGNKIEGITRGDQVAVDPNSHVIYVTEKNALKAFEADGEPHEFTAGPDAAGTSEISGFGEAVTGVAVDANGTIYVSDWVAGSVYVYASTGEPLMHFEGPHGPQGPGNLAVASDGAVYVNDLANNNHGTYRYTPSEFPVTSTTTFAKDANSLTGNLYQEAQGVAVDPLTGDVYISGETGSESSIAQYDSNGALVRYYGKAGEPGELGHSSVGGVAVDGTTKKFYVGNRLSSSNSKVEIFGAPVFLPLPPTVESTSALNVTADSAKLRAEVNPNTLETTYRFEYGPEDCSVTTCTELTPANPDLGSGHKGVFAFAQLFYLQPGTTYHYRVIAENELAEGEDAVEGPDRTFTTQLSGLGFELADSRAWEMVSPPDKHGATLILATVSRIQAADDGESLAYSSYGSIEADPEGNRLLEGSTALARRGPGGWSSRDLTPPQTKAEGIYDGGYMVFSPDLSRALYKPHDDAPLSPQADERTPYIRENTEPHTFTPLLTHVEGFANVPPGVAFGKTVTLKGADPSLGHVAFTSTAALVSGAQVESLYLWADGEISPVSEKPAGEGGAVVGAILGSDVGSVRNAISGDGSRVFWATPEYNPANISSSALYLRDTEAEESVRLDVAQPGGSGEGKSIPAFQGASADGTVVFFTDSQQLTADASPEGRDLYRCEIPAGESANGCATLTDISAPLAGSGESAKTKGVVPGFSEDGTRIYFVAEAKLDGEPNEEGETATSGAPNLYRWEESAGTRFIATLSGKDLTDWGAAGSIYGLASGLSSAASPDGRRLTFMSQRSLTGYDNTDAISGEANQEVFAYDAVSDELSCASCNPTGASPVGQRAVVNVGEGASRKVDPRDLFNNEQSTAAILPQASAGDGIGTTLHQPRYVLDNGRVFFNAFDSLVAADSNGQWDVYQWEPLGTGTCTASSAGAAVSRSEGGCVSLISSGTAEEEAAFLDTSESGDDVFFLSTAKLSVLDEDAVYDVYDARVDGVPARLTPRTECLGEACAPAPNPPNDPTPASASFRGAGNEPSTRCPKGKKRQLKNNGSSRCVAHKKHKKKHPHKAKRAANKRRAGR